MSKVNKNKNIEKTELDGFSKSLPSFKSLIKDANLFSLSLDFFLDKGFIGYSDMFG